MKNVDLKSLLFLLMVGIASFSLVVIFGSSKAGSSNNSEILRVPEDFTSIQSAIDAASSGSIVQIASGEFNENLKIDKAISLVGAGLGETIIRGQGTPKFANSSSSTFTTIEIATDAESFSPIAVKDMDIIAFEVIEPTSNDRTIGIYLDGSVRLDLENVLIAGRYGLFIIGVGSGSQINLYKSRIESSEVGIRVFGNTNGFDGKTFPLSLNIISSELINSIEFGDSILSHDAVATHTSIIQSRLQGAIGLRVGGDLTVANSVLEKSSGIDVLGSRASIWNSTISSNTGTAISLSPYEWGESALDLNSSKIINNSGFGIIIQGSECNPNSDYAALSEYNLDRVHISGRGNTIEGNVRGNICPAGYPLPSGFLIPF